MPYRTHWKENGIVWEFYGDVTAQEIERANAEFYRDARSDEAKYQIVDARDVASVEWQERDIKTVAAYDLGASRTLRNVRVALVADDGEIMEKLDRYADLSRRLNSSWQFERFETLEPARAWVRDR